MHSVSVTNIILISLQYAYCNINPIDGTLSARVTEHRLQQPLDHFDPNETRTFRMEYLQRLDFWQPNGPVYLWMFHFGYPFDDLNRKMLTIDWFLPVAMAKETNGSLFAFDQRYHPLGIDIPLPQDKDFFKFLNTTQSLADIAAFIKFVKLNPRLQSSKVVILGYGFYGTLATWFRMLYPDLVDAVIAVGAPLLAKKDYKELYDIIHNLYEKYGSKDCIKKMETYEHTLGELVSNETDIEALKNMFHVCKQDNFTMMIDRRNFMEVRYRDFYETARFGTPGAIKHACDMIPTDSITMISSTSPTEICFEYHVDFWASMPTMFPSFYQACTEFGQFATTTSEKEPFVYWNPVKYFVEKCNHFFGIDEKRIDAGISETNRMFGGLTPNVTNVVFTWGELDPYRLLGVQKNLSDSAPAFVINGDSYFNIFHIKNREPKETTKIREQVKSLVKKWISSS